MSVESGEVKGCVSIAVLTVDVKCATGQAETLTQGHCHGQSVTEQASSHSTIFTVCIHCLYSDT